MRFFTLENYIELLDVHGLLAGAPACRGNDLFIRHFSFNSKDVIPGTLFVAKGVHFKKEYLDEAFAAGAVAYVAGEQVAGHADRLIKVKDVRRAMALLSREFYNDPASELSLFGLTGTKGKSTTATFLKAIFDLDARRKGGQVCGLSSTVDLFDGKTHVYPDNTTPEAPDLWRLLSRGLENGLSRFVVECSSQSIKYERVYGMRFRTAAITNIGYDHISPSEHPDFADYMATKLSIYSMADTACVCLDDEHSADMLKAASGCQRIVTFGEADGAEVRISGARRENGVTKFTVAVPGGSCEFSMTMPGLFNSRNALCAVAMAYTAGIPLEICAEALRDVRVSGRMDRYVSRDGKVTVIIDFAHNELSFRTLFESAAADYPGYGVVTVTGWYGGKAENRRREVGLLTGRFSDLTVICEKDSGDEPFMKIASEAAVWIASTGGKYAIIENRYDALKYAFGVDFGDRKKLILLCGLGDERKIKRGGSFVYTPSDSDNLRTILGEYDAAHPAGE